MTTQDASNTKPNNTEALQQTDLLQDAHAKTADVNDNEQHRSEEHELAERVSQASDNIIRNLKKTAIDTHPQEANQNTPKTTASSPNDTVEALKQEIEALRYTIDKLSTERKYSSRADRARKITGEQAAENILGPNPVVGLRGRDIIDTTRLVATQALREPVHSFKHVLSFGKALSKIVTGQSELKPSPKDKRFLDPAWKENIFYKSYLQAYLAWRDEINDWIDESELSKDDIERAKFVVSLLTEAVAPSNTLANPVAVKRLLETNGSSLVRGMQNLLDDLKHNGGMPSQVDRSKFEVGKNLANTPGSVVFRNEILELIQYGSQTEKVKSRPVLYVPPQINKFYIFDLSPGKSLMDFSVKAGFQSFVISWRNPTVEESHWGVEAYVKGLEDAIDAIIEITGSKDVNMVGACSGGIVASSLLGYLAAKGSKKVNATTLFVSILQTQFESQPALFMDEKTIDAAKRYSAKKGLLEGQDMAKVFAWMRPNDLVWNYWVNNYLIGNPPPAFDILYWNNDTTRLPAQLHHDYLNMYQQNPLKSQHKLIIDNEVIDLANVDCDFYIVAGTTDHITPWKACYETCNMVGGNAEFVLSHSGHIQSILNPIGNKKASYMTNNTIHDTPEAWQASATTHQGSWWSHWESWLGTHSGRMKNAPQTLGSESHPPICAAPGEYIKEP